MNSYRYRVVDVFTTNQFEGNALAVFTDARGIGDATMQRIARELNLSETVFVFPATRHDSTARLRIFTPYRELPFAGHPTVGTSFVLFDEGAPSLPNGGFVLEEPIGLVPVRIDRGDPPMFWLTTPPIRDEGVFDRSACAALVGLSLEDTLDVQPQLLNAGNPTLLIALRDQDAVDRAWLDGRAAKMLRPEPFCVFVFAPTPAGAYSRMFAPDYGVSEDPATGSSTGPLALYMMRNGLAPSTSGTRFVSEQGTKMGRRSMLHVNILGDMGREAIEVGGHATAVAEGSLSVGR